MENVEDRIRERAHLIWEREGRPTGREFAHWEMAAAELAAEDAAASIAAPAADPAPAKKPRAPRKPKAEAVDGAEAPAPRKRVARPKAAG